jgi:hypothetical protein
MKTNYIQPTIEVAEVFATSLMQAGSPGININQTPIDNEGGD